MCGDDRNVLASRQIENRPLCRDDREPDAALDRQPHGLRQLELATRRTADVAACREDAIVEAPDVHAHPARVRRPAATAASPGFSTMLRNVPSGPTSRRAKLPTRAAGIPLDRIELVPLERRQPGAVKLDKCAQAGRRIQIVRVQRQERPAVDERLRSPNGVGRSERLLLNDERQP